MEHPLLREEHIIAGLEALNHEEALDKIINSLPSWGLNSIEKQSAIRLLCLRESIGTTAIGQGIALPHCFSPEVQEPVLAFGVSPQGIPFQSLDGRPVHFVFVLILPQNEGTELLKRQLLQNIKWLLCDRAMQERLKAATSASAIYRLIVPEPAYASMPEVSGF